MIFGGINSGRHAFLDNEAVNISIAASENVVLVIFRNYFQNSFSVMQIA